MAGRDDVEQRPDDRGGDTTSTPPVTMAGDRGVEEQEAGGTAPANVTASPMVTRRTTAPRRLPGSSPRVQVGGGLEQQKADEQGDGKG